MLPFRFAIGASFTAEPIQPVIEFWGRRLNADFEVRFAPYNQLQQTLLDPQGVFAANPHGMNVLLFRLEDLGGDPSQVETHANELVRIIRDAAPSFSVPVVICLCPSSMQNAADPVRARLDAQLRNCFRGWLEDFPGVHLFEPEEIHGLYPVDDPNDPDAERLGRIPYTELYFCALGSTLVRHAHALFTPPYKVIALDCDNTLWQGICGEDGPSGIVVDPPRAFLQRFMLEQREAGMLLAMCSKNNEQDVLDTFTANPQMPLQLRHFTARRTNWESKPENLAAISQELSLGLDSFIFVDDSPKECAEMAENAPDVLALPLPAQLTRIPEFLNNVWAFDHPIVTEEDRHRNAYYTQAQEFGQQVKGATNLAEFVAGLRLEVTFTPLTEAHLSRAAQLTQRTNQFNFTTVRRTERELQTLLREPGHACVTVEVSDRFGGYGVVGVMIYDTTSPVLTIDTFLVSCRVLGRGVEHRMLAWLGEQAAHSGLSHVVARLVTSKKNQPARQFLHAVGHDVEAETAAGFEYRFDAQALSNLRWSQSSSVEAPRQQAKPSTSAGRRIIDYAAIACELATPAQILEAMRRESLTSNGEGMTDVERQLAAIWSDLLKCPTVSVSDNFFDLGGHSLLAVLLILRVREAFGIELPIDDVYSATLTLGELARKIETYQLSSINPEEYEALLAEIENLSDEEVQALLSKEDAQ